MNDVLALRDGAKYQLEQIKDIESGIEYLNKVKGIEVWAKAEKKDAELQNMIAEQKIRTQRILGSLIKEGQRVGEIANPGGDRISIMPQRNNGKTLSEIGLTAKQSSNFQQISQIPEESFESFISEKKTSVDEAVSELTTAGILAFAKNKPHVSNNSGENEWYTPEHLITSARTVMGVIDLDPASSKAANNTVQAKKYYDIESNGLVKDWFGNIWINPPYSQPLISMFAKKINDEILNIKQACILTNNATETEWYQTILQNSSAVCFLKTRVKFLDINGKANGAPLQGQTIIYIGNNSKEFNDEFKKYGICMRRIV